MNKPSVKQTNLLIVFIQLVKDNLVHLTHNLWFFYVAHYLPQVILSLKRLQYKNKVNKEKDLMNVN